MGNIQVHRKKQKCFAGEILRERKVQNEQVLKTITQVMVLVVLMEIE